MISQKDRYEDFYSPLKKLKWLFRFDVRYRSRRLHEVFAMLGIPTSGARVLDFGFGTGELLKSFPADCSLTGVDVSGSAVRSARADKDFRQFQGADFQVIGETSPQEMPPGPFDIIVSSHALEHVQDDLAVLRIMLSRLRASGIVALFVPIEESDYIEFHRRTYSIQSFTEKVMAAGFEILHVEGSMYINGHIWKALTVPSRRHWPVISKLADMLRLTTLSSIPYPLVKVYDRVLYSLGFGARQVLVVARRG